MKVKRCQGLTQAWSARALLRHVLARRPALQAKGARLVAVTSVRGCRLASMCDMAVHLPLERELCPFDLAPVTSTAAQMLFGDTVAIALMQVCSLLPCSPVPSIWPGRQCRRCCAKAKNSTCGADCVTPMPNYDSWQHREHCIETCAYSLIPMYFRRTFAKAHERGLHSPQGLVHLQPMATMSTLRRQSG